MSSSSSYGGIPAAGLSELLATKLLLKEEGGSILPASTTCGGGVLLPPWEQTERISILPSKRRHIHPNLEAHGGHLLLYSSSQTTGGSTSENPVAAGIDIHGWKIGTSQGPIGDSQWFEHATTQLERISQPRNHLLLQQDAATAVAAAVDPSKHRQLALPEMVFPLAHIVLDYEYEPSQEDGQTATDCKHHVGISINAMEFLQEWAEVHQDIALPESFEQESDTTGASTATAAISSSSRGVSILKTSDASLWKKKSNVRTADEYTHSSAATAKPEVIIGSTTFHYDWTYSSPYSGRLYSSANGNCNDDDKNNSHWQTLPQSGMPMHLLTDTTVPILLFDQIVFAEDDLHDNGQTQFSAKIRVMPTCAYILTQLFVRVDNVLIRVRESRWMVEFSSVSKPGTEQQPQQQQQPPPPQTIVIYRDVTWRECAWKQLAAHQLPTNIQAWTQNEAWQPQDAVAFAQLLQKVPIVTLPPDIPAHGRFVMTL
jgi:TIP41-like family